MQASDDRPPPPTHHGQDGFAVSGGQFICLGYERMDAKTLGDLWLPGNSRQRILKKAFFEAQFRHYDIEFRLSSTLAQRSNLLQESIRQGKCDSVPESILHLEQSMRREYGPLHRKWEDDVRARDARKKQLEDEAWAKCKTPAEKASHNSDRFVDHFFLTNGKPNKKKTPAPLALVGLHSRATLHVLAKKVPGLQTKSVGSDADTNFALCNGWDRSAVLRLAGQFAEESLKKIQQEEEAEQDEHMEAHGQYVAKVNRRNAGKKGKAASKKSAQSFKLDDCVGTYLVICDEVAGGWDHISNDFTLSTDSDEDGILIAAYDFGIIEGTMLLGLSEEKLDRAAKGCRGGAKKQKKTASAGSRRVHYGMRGRGTGESEVFYDPKSGHLDFDAQGVAFKGLARSFPYVGQNVEFTGYKVSDDPEQQPEDWDSFSPHQYEYERQARWH